MTGPAQRGEIARGLAYMSAAMFILPVMDAFAKVLGQRLPPMEVAFGRMAGQMVLAFLIAVVLGRVTELRPPQLLIQFLRGACLGLATLCFFVSIATLPLADALAIFFVQPMILTALSAVLLKEEVGWRRWVACAVGFAGAVLIARPGIGVFQPAALLPLGSACVFAVYLLLTRRLSGQGGLLAQQFVTGVAGTVVIGAAMLAMIAFGIEGAAFRLPQGIDWLFLLAIATISLFGHGMVVKALSLAPATVLAPMNYLEIVSAVALGWLIFSDFPDTLTWIGIALIVASGLYIVHRERQRHRLDSAVVPAEV